jgi:hypothetical protein
VRLGRRHHLRLDRARVVELEADQGAVAKAVPVRADRGQMRRVTGKRRAAVRDPQAEQPRRPGLGRGGARRKSREQHRQAERDCP